MMEVMGPMPDALRRVDFDVRVEEDRSDGEVRKQKITFGVEKDDRALAWLFVPQKLLAQGTKPQAAMLCLHQSTKLGKDEPAGFGGKPNLQYAMELAKRGYVTLTPDYPYFGESQVDPYALGYVSATMKGIWNHMRAVDLLASLPYVDAKRIGCIGHSLGGHNTMFVTAFDERIRLAVSSCGFTLFTHNRGGGAGPLNDVSDWSHKGYMPRIKEKYDAKGEKMPFDWDDVLSAVAPRPVYVNAPEHDDFLAEGVRICVGRVQHLWEKAGAKDKLVLDQPVCQHDFPPEVRERAYKFIDANL